MKVKTSPSGAAPLRMRSASSNAALSSRRCWQRLAEQLAGDSKTTRGDIEPRGVPWPTRCKGVGPTGDAVESTRAARRQTADPADARQARRRAAAGPGLDLRAQVGRLSGDRLPRPRRAPA